MSNRIIILAALLLGCVAPALAAEDTNIVAAAQVDADAAWESVFTSSNQIPFHINLYMQNGLYYEMMETSEYDGSFYTSVFSEKRRLTGRLGAKLQLDGALYKEDGTVPATDNGFAIRRLRVNTYGRAFFLSPLTYGLEFGITDGDFYFNDGYIWFHKVPYIRSVKLGVFTTPLSMESLQSSSTIPMMERGSPVSSFAPGEKLGAALGGALPGDRATLFGGVFGDVVDTESADASESSTRIIGRLTWLLNDGTEKANPRLIHLGLSGSFMSSSGSGVQYRSRPESFQAPYLIDTGEGSLQGDRAYIIGLEGATQLGPIVLQSEFIMANADDAADNLYQFWGSYVMSSVMLTGETRPYNRKSGNFRGIEPQRKFSFSDRTWGALEWASRISYTDLSDGAVQGGIMGVLSTGLNVYLSPRNRIMFDVGAANVKDTIYDGALYFFQTRLQIEL